MSHDGSEALTQALAKLAEKWEAKAARAHPNWERGHRVLSKCAAEVRAALAGAAPTPKAQYPADDVDSLLARLADVVNQWLREIGRGGLQITKPSYPAVCAAIDELGFEVNRARAASEGSRGAPLNDAHE